MQLRPFVRRGPRLSPCMLARSTDPSTSKRLWRRSLPRGSFGSWISFRHSRWPPTDTIHPVHTTTHISPLSVIIRISEAYAVRKMGPLSRGSAVYLRYKALAPVAVLAWIEFGAKTFCPLTALYGKRFGSELTIGLGSCSEMGSNFYFKLILPRLSSRLSTDHTSSTNENEDRTRSVAPPQPMRFLG